MKLSFSLPSKPSSRPNPVPSQTFVTEDQNDRENSSTNSHEFVTEFTASTAPNESGSSLPFRKFVIPPLENEWEPIKNMMNIDLPSVRSNGEDLEFEVEARSLTEPLHFGLNLRRSVEDNSTAVKYLSDENNRDAQHPTRYAPVESVLLQRLKNDLERLPEHRGLEEFDDIPVGDFGTALLIGYGWHEGRGIGKNAKEDVKSVQYERKVGTAGLGFVANAPMRAGG